MFSPFLDLTYVSRNVNSPHDAAALWYGEESQQETIRLPYNQRSKQV